MKQRRGGFTLLELIAVITIMALMVGVAALRLDYMFPKYRLRGGAREVCSLIKRARSHAAATGKDVYIHFPKGDILVYPKS
jgi:prepilin-type N-terminal cleavage/methylation domain-containing protein